MSFVRKTADILHKATVTGLIGATVFGLVNVGGMIADVTSQMTAVDTQSSNYQAYVKAKIEEDSKKKDDVNSLFTKREDE